MGKITDPGYFLPVIETLEVIQQFESGRTYPVLINGICITSLVKSEYVAKLSGAEEIQPVSLGKELLCSFIGLELDLNIPQPVIINLSDEAVASLGGFINTDYIKKSLGYNFGSKYFEGYNVPVVDELVPEILLGKFIELFAFDVFIENPDRRIKKPNFLIKGTDILIIDHELALSFKEVFSFSRNPKPWELEPERHWIENNFLFPILRGKSLDFKEFTNRLIRLNDIFWHKADSLIPNDWNNGLVEEARNHLKKKIEHKDHFALELKRILS